MFVCLFVLFVCFIVLSVIEKVTHISPLEQIEDSVFSADPGYCPVKLGMMSGRLQSGVNTLQGFKEDKRNRISPGKAPLGGGVLTVFSRWPVDD